MFQLRPDLAGVLRRQRTPEAFAKLFAGSALQTIVEPTSRDVIARAPGAASTRYSFDPQGFVSRITTPLLRQWQFTSDKDGRVESVTNPGGSTARFAYDPRGRLAHVFRDSHPLFSLQYDELGNLVRTHYADATSESLIYRNYELLTRAVRRTAITQAFEYDEQNCLTAIIDGQGNRTHYQYDRWNRPDSAVFPDGSEERYEYDEEGYLRSFFHASGRQVVLQRDEAGRPVQITYPDGTELKRAFDAAGHLVTARGPQQEFSWQYDEQGRVISEQSAAAKIEYSYATTGHFAGIRYPDGEQVAFSWDEDGRLVGIRDWSGVDTRWNYPEAESGWTVRFPGGVHANTYLKPTGLIGAIRVQQATTRTSLLSLVYEYNSEDRVAVCEDSLAGRCEFSYDPDGRVLTAGRERFAYDAADNRILTPQGQASFNAANLPVNVGGVQCVHDDRGNLVEGPAEGGVWQLRWDACDRLSRAQGARGEAITYGYDALGRRSWRREGERETQYIWAGETLIAEIERSQGRVLRQQEYLFIPGTHTLFATRINGQVLYAHCDHLGTPRLLTDASGNAVWSVTFDAWGSPTQIWGDKVHQPWRFPGQYVDEATGLHDNRFRVYSPALGRYLSRDPLGYTAGLNLFSYAGNDPINNADPLGLWSWKGVVTTVAAVAVGVAVTAAVIALAPVATPFIVGAAIVAGGAMAGAVAGGLNQALNESEFCATCILIEALKGFGVGAVAALPFAFLPATAGVAAFASVGGASGALGYFGNLLAHPGTPFSLSDLALSVGIGVVTAGAGRYIAGRLWPTRSRLLQSAARGKAFEQRGLDHLETVQSDVQSQVSIRPYTTTGELADIRVRLDALGRDDAQNIRLTDFKSSDAAGFTRNQRMGYPLLEKYGGQVVGNNGGAAYPAGTQIPPTHVDILRPGDF